MVRCPMLPRAPLELACLVVVSFLGFSFCIFAVSSVGLRFLALCRRPSFLFSLRNVRLLALQLWRSFGVLRPSFAFARCSGDCFGSLGRLWPSLHRPDDVPFSVLSTESLPFLSFAVSPSFLVIWSVRRFAYSLFSRLVFLSLFSFCGYSFLLLLVHFFPLSGPV